MQALREDIQALVLRVTSLEEAASAERSPSAVPRTQEESAEGDFWALNGLRERLPAHPATAKGAVMLVGAVTLPTGAQVEWQQTAGTSEMLEGEWEDRAAALMALGHPIRLELLRQILSGIHSTADLAASKSLGTTGQLHHHLRQLLSAGWLKHSGRGAYEVPASRVVPLLACLVAVGG